MNSQKAVWASRCLAGHGDLRVRMPWVGALGRNAKGPAAHTHPLCGQLPGQSAAEGEPSVSTVAIWYGMGSWATEASPPNTCLVPRSSAVRRSGSTSPLGFARASPSPPAHAEHGGVLARKMSLGGGRPYTPSPQGAPAGWGLGRGVSRRWVRRLSLSQLDPSRSLFSPSWNHP